MESSSPSSSSTSSTSEDTSSTPPPSSTTPSSSSTSSNSSSSSTPTVVPSSSSSAPSELPKQGSTRNLKELFERLSEREKQPEHSPTTGRAYSTLPRSFKPFNTSSLCGSSDAMRMAIAESRILASEREAQQPQAQTQVKTTFPSARAKRSLPTKGSGIHRSVTSVAQDLSSSPRLPRTPREGVLAKPEQLLDTVKYLKDNHQRFSRFFSGPDVVVDQIKIQTLISSSQMFMDVLEKQIQEVVAFLSQNADNTTSTPQTPTNSAVYTTPLVPTSQKAVQSASTAELSSSSNSNAPETEKTNDLDNIKALDELSKSSGPIEIGELSKAVEELQRLQNSKGKEPAE